MKRSLYHEQSTLEKVIDFFKFKDLHFRYNELKDVIEIKEKTQDWNHIDDRRINDMLLLIADSTSELKNNIKTIQKLRLYIENSYVSPNYNPVASYFNSLEHDGKDHIAQLVSCLNFSQEEILLSNGKIVNCNEQFEKFIRIWLRGCVGSFYTEKGNQVMLLLVGDQGIYKTTFLNNLIPPTLKDNLYSGHIMPSLKENFTCDLLAEKYLINIDDQVEELLSQKFQEIKSVITSDYVSNRKVFRRDAKRRKRIANFVGSANSRNLFMDSENRRYLALEVKSIDIFRMQKIDIDQVWAQAKSEFLSGKQFHFGKDDMIIFHTINDEFATKSIEQEYLMLLFQPANPEDPKVSYMQMSEIAKVIRRASGANISISRLVGVWKKLNYPNKISKRIKGISYPVYVYPVIKKYTDDGINIGYDENESYT